MSTMYAINPTNTPEEPLNWTQVQRPQIAPHEVLLKVRATAVNRADLSQRQGRYNPPPGASQILGLEAAGEIVEVGKEVNPSLQVQVGQHACALLAGGGYAQYVALPATHLMPIPQGFSLTQAAALPEVFCTAWLNLFMEANLQPGDWALIHAAASGVGTAALQLCRLQGVHTIATASGGKLPLCKELGATVTHDRHQGSFVEVVKDATQGEGVSAILDPVVGPDYISWDLQSLRTEGTLVVIGLMGGREASLPLGKVLVKRIRIVGSTLRSRSDAYKANVIQQLTQHVWPNLSLNDPAKVRPIIDRVLSVTQAEEAHELLASNATQGKVILTVPHA